MINKFSLLVIFCMIALLSMTSSVANAATDDDQVHVIFKASDENIANPERGIFHHLGFSPGDGAVSASYLQNCRTNEKITIFFTMYHLDDFSSSEISDSFLNLIRTNMLRLRQNGAKCILRFSYSDSEDQHPWDATWEWMQIHIQQLKPILNDYSDVIALMEAGFVGVWGEWYYTDNYVYQPSKYKYAARTKVLDALLDALPSDRFINVRTPMYKLFCSNIEPTDTITELTAYNGSKISRIGFHNDAFLADEDDMGTYENVPAYRLYVKKETRFVPMGGETDQMSSYCEDENARQNFADYHWSYLNQDYLGAIIRKWENSGLMDEIRLKLGYRFQLTDAYIPVNVNVGSTMKVKLNIANVGWASPFNKRDAYFVLFKGYTEIARFAINTDVRHFSPGTTSTIESTINLPDTLSTGVYRLCLDLPDAKLALKNNPDFSIRLANVGVWDEKIGMNVLSTIHVNASTGISEIKQDENSKTPFYSISGEKLSDKPNGLYVHNGRKYFNMRR
jgi:hypothetical protein